MKMSRLVLAVLLLTAAVAPLAAEEIAAPTTPVVDLSFADAGAQTAALRCVQYFCPVYPEFGCSCEWVPCDGGEVCGVPRNSAISASTESGCGSLVNQSSAL